MNTRIYISTIIFLLVLSTFSHAQQSIVLDSLIQEAGNFALSGSANSNFALELTSGDFNGDGIQDIVYTSSDDVGNGGADTRGITILFGSNGLSNSGGTTVRFRLDPANPPSSFEFGTEAGSGDLNNDGIDDLIVGVPEWDNEKGLLYVVYGKQVWPDAVVNLGSLTANDGFKVFGRISEEPGNLGKAGSRLGDGYAIGDIDNDNLNDLYISAPRSNTSFDQGSGAAYVIFGKAIQANLEVDLDTLSENSGMVIHPSNPNEGVGNEAMFADLTGDGIEDLLMVAENAWSQGRVHVIHGSTSLPDSLDLNSNSTNSIRTTIFGSLSPSQTRFGKDIDTGDFNGDGALDLIVSASRTGGIQGSVYIMFGGTGVFEGNVLPTSMSQGEGIIINGLLGDFLGLHLDVADFNNDGFDDVVFTGGIHDLDPGITQFYKNRLRILFGTDEALPLTLDLENPDVAFNFTEITALSDQRDIGNSVIAIDINNDSNTDLIFGSYSRDQNTFDDLFGLNFILNIDFEQNSVTEDTVRFAGGAGTEMDPYQIATAAQLDSVRFFPNANFVQTADIDLGPISSTGWIPIGYAQDDTYLLGERAPFSGVYDGGGYTIENLNINNRDKIIGMFYAVTGTVKNVVIDGANFELLPNEEIPVDIVINNPMVVIGDAPRFSGIVAGRVEEGGMIDSVEVRNAQIEFGSLGLIAGWNEGTISNSSAQGIIMGAFQAGGLVSVNAGEISRSSFQGSILSIDNLIGGLVGSNLEGDISESFAEVEIEKTIIFGGLVGVYEYGTVENNYVEFQVNDSSSTGGIIGSYGISATLDPNQDPLSVRNNYAFGEIAFRDADMINTYRGIIGFAFQTPSNAAISETKVKDNYWNTDLFGAEDAFNAVNFRITTGGITSEQMSMQNTFTGWDFINIWDIDEGTSFPYLRQNPPSEKPGGGIVTSNERLISELPNEIQLSQNYPNPFNPSTNIDYSLPNAGTVRLEVFDILGRSVSVLVNNEFQRSGAHTVTFNAQNLSSGVYIYQLSMENSVSLTRRLTLIK